MTTVLAQRPSDTRIEMRTCINRGGHYYTHAFIGGYAISKKLQNILVKEFNFPCHNGISLPEAFFMKYSLIAVDPDYEDADRETFVTSDHWYTCNPRYVNVNL